MFLLGHYEIRDSWAYSKNWPCEGVGYQDPVAWGSRVTQTGGGWEVRPNSKALRLSTPLHCECQASWPLGLPWPPCSSRCWHQGSGLHMAGRAQPLWCSRGPSAWGAGGGHKDGAVACVWHGSWLCASVTYRCGGWTVLLSPFIFCLAFLRGLLISLALTKRPPWRKLS